MKSALSLPLLSDRIMSGVVVPVRVLLMGQIEMFNVLLRIIILSYLKPYKCSNCLYYREILDNSNYHC